MTNISHEREVDRIRHAYAARAAADYGDRYSYFNPGNLFIIQDRDRAMLRVLREAACHPLGQRNILEVGCGTGFWLRQFIQWGADPNRLCGLELDRARAAHARRACPAATTIVVADAGRAPVRSASFDLVFQSTLFTSVLDDEVRRALANEMLRAVRPGGLILWYDFRYNNPSNPDVRGIGRREIERLFPGCAMQFHSLTLAPILARTLAPVSWTGCRLMNLVPPLRTHLLVVIRGRADAPRRES